MSEHGGKREGAGRKPTGRTVRKTFFLSPECGFELLTEIAFELGMATGIALPDSLLDWETFDRYLSRVTSSCERVAIALDEYEWFQDVWKGSKLPDGFPQKLYDLTKTSNITLILSGDRLLTEMDERLFGKLGAIATVLKLSPLNRAAVSALFQEEGFPKCSQDALEKIYTLSKGYPFALNLIAFELRRLQLEREIATSDVDAVSLPLSKKYLNDCF